MMTSHLATWHHAVKEMLNHIVDRANSRFFPAVEGTKRATCDKMGIVMKMVNDPIKKAVAAKTGGRSRYRTSRRSAG